MSGRKSEILQPFLLSRGFTSLWWLSFAFASRSVRFVVNPDGITYMSLAILYQPSKWSRPLVTFGAHSIRL